MKSLIFLTDSLLDITVNFYFFSQLTFCDCNPELHDEFLRHFGSEFYKLLWLLLVKSIFFLGKRAKNGSLSHLTFRGISRSFALLLNRYYWVELFGVLALVSQLT